MWEEDGKQGWENCARSGDGNERRFAHDGNGDNGRNSGVSILQEEQVGVEIRHGVGTMRMGM